MAPRAIQNYVNTLPGVRNVIGIGEDLGSGAAGVRVRTLRTQYGDAKLMPDLFLSQKYSRYKTPPSYNATSNPKPTNVPAAPVTLVPVAAGTGSQFEARDITDFGTYYYAVTADNSHTPSTELTGESDPLVYGGIATPTGIAVLAGQSVTITITDVASAVSYRVYRAVNNPTILASYQFIGEVVDSGAATTVFVDSNATISHTKDSSGQIQNCEVGFGFTLPTFANLKSGERLNMLYEMDVEDAVKRVDLAPMFSRPQAIIGDKIVNELLLHYTCVEVPLPNQNVVFKNSGNRNL
jgi:hypothetical protein